MQKKESNGLAKEKNEPFFAYFAFHEPHSVVASPKELVDKYSDLPKKDAEYLANIDNLDLAIGKILNYLTKNNLMENTIIIFSSDNGSYRVKSNGGLGLEKVAYMRAVFMYQELLVAWNYN